MNDDGIECDMRVGNLTCDLVNRSCSVGSTDILSAPLREDLSSDISGFSSLEPEAVFKDMRAGRHCFSVNWRTGPCRRRNLPLVISLNISLCHHQKCWTNTPLLLDSMHACSIRISLIDCIRRWCGQFASNTKNRQRDSTASALMIRDDNRVMNQVSTSNPCKQSVSLSRSPPRQLRGRIRCPLRCEAVSTLRTFWPPPMRRLQGGFALPADRSLGFAGRLGEHPRVNSLRRSDQGLLSYSIHALLAV